MAKSPADLSGSAVKSRVCVPASEVGDEFDGHAGVYLSMELTAMLNLSTSASGISLP